MPRTARVILPNYPHHIIQRGHNKQAVFASDDDYLFYIENLKEWKEKLGCKIYAYCIMTNHVHIVIDPGEDESNLGKLMKRIAGRQTRYINKIEGRSGTLWESRYKSSPISNDEYLMICCRYVELNPLRAGMVERPEAYRWSSCRHKLGLEKNDWLDAYPVYAGLGDSEEVRSSRYREWLDSSISESELKLIRESVQRGQLTGDGSFVEEVANMLGRRIEMRGQGRPNKAEK